MSVHVVRVALPVPLPQLFDYTAENVLASDLGRCVRVPFGPTEKNGVIVAVDPPGEVALERLKPVSAIQRDAPALPPDWLALDAVLCCGGSWMIPKGAPDLAAIEAAARIAAGFAR